jgi:ring-1,2-phenylacetyl-CoA epoxidase subunit PaaC
VNDRQAIVAGWLVAVADDEMVLGQRNSEWTGHGPILEDDIALSNIALDEIGHAQLWYRLAAEVVGEDPDRHPDRLVFGRPAAEFRNAPLVELPRGDWGFTLMRQFLFDLWEQVRLPRWVKAPHTGVAQVAGKIAREERYHIRYSRAWVRRLGMGTPESHARMQAALNILWPHAAGLVAPLPGEDVLLARGELAGGDGLAQEWSFLALAEVARLGLEVRQEPRPDPYDRRSHTEHLANLVAEMQQVARLEPQAAW